MSLQQRRGRRVVLGAVSGLLLVASTVGAVPVRPVYARAIVREDEQAEPVSASRMAGIPLPEGAVLLKSAEALEPLLAQLKSATEKLGFSLSKTEILIWGGKGHDAERTHAVQKAIREALEEDGYTSKTLGEENSGEVKVASFLAQKEDGKALLAFWLMRDDVMMLAWGPVTEKKTAASKSSNSSGHTEAEQKRLNQALEEAIEAGATTDVKAKLKEGANANGRAGEQPFLMRAIIGGKTEIVAALLEAGADPDRGNDDGSHIPVYTAALTGKTAILELLLDKGADVNAATPEKGLTGLHAAAIGGQAEAATLLLKYKADPKKRDKTGKTARQIAEQFQNEAVATVLQGVED